MWKSAIIVLVTLIMLGSTATATVVNNENMYWNGIPQDSLRKISELYGKGRSAKEIAEELVIPLEIVEKYLRGEYSINAANIVATVTETSDKVVKSNKSEKSTVIGGAKTAGSQTIDFTTVGVEEYGNVTVPKEYVKKVGEKIEITVNSTSGKLITPVIERLPPVKWITVKTPYGLIQTPAGTLERLGKENFMNIQKKFFTAFREIKEKESGVKNIETKKLDSYRLPVTTVTVKSSTFVGEWASFYRKDNSQKPYWISGKIDPAPPYNTGQSFTSYHEREVYLGYGTGDAVEFISHHLQDGKRNIWVAVYDDDKWMTNFTLYIQNVSDPVEYYFYIDETGRKYHMWLVYGEIKRYNYYDDSDDFSSYINCFMGSTELYYDSLSKAFDLFTEIQDDWTKIGDKWYRPAEIFEFTQYSEEKPYVEINATWNSEGITRTEHETKYPEPGVILKSESGTLSSSGETYNFSVYVSTQSNVTVVMAGNENADFDLYAKWGSPPTTRDYDARGYSVTSLEYFTLEGSGTLYIMVRSYSGSGHWKAWAISGFPKVDSSRKTGILSGGGDTEVYSTTPSFGKGYAFCSGPDDSDFDLYLKWNSQPTTTDYDAYGYSSWSQEVAGPAEGSGKVYFMVRSFAGSGEYTALGLIF